MRRYESLWSELTHEETFAADERFRVDERLRRLNALGFDVEEIQLVATPERLPAAARPARGRAGPPSPSPAAADRSRRAGEPGPADAERHRALSRGARAAAAAPALRVGRRVALAAGGVRADGRRRSRPSCRAACRPPRCSTRCSSTAGSSPSARARTSGSRRPSRSYVEGELPQHAPERVMLETDSASGWCRPGGAMPPGRSTGRAWSRSAPRRATRSDGRLAGAHRDPLSALRPMDRLQRGGGEVMNRIRGHCTSSHVWEATAHAPAGSSAGLTIPRRP